MTPDGSISHGRTARTATIRTATPADDDLLVRHYLAICSSYGGAWALPVPNAADVVRAFLETARAERDGSAVLAEVGGRVLGSAACARHLAPYPMVTEAPALSYGYIWSVWVEPDARGQGLATRLVEACLDHLRSLGCTTAILHASAAGAPVYARLGFQPATEMRRTL